MSFSINDFQSVISRRKGVVQPNKYSIFIDAPNKIPNSFKSADLNFLAESISVPSRSIATADQKTNGPLRKIARESIYGELAVEFLMTNDYLAKNFFDAWMVQVQNDRAYNNSYYDDYIGTIWFASIPAHKEYIVPTQAASDPDYWAVKIEEAFPTATGELSYGYGQNNSYLKLQVTFSYRRWINTNLLDGITGNPKHPQLYG